MTIRKPQLLSLGVFVVLLGVAFAAFTQHVWEDYYITFRSSKNLAEGHGLVFNPGERVHTFTSPLGVLLPAAAAWVSGTDQTALWLYRLISLAALAGGCCFVGLAARRMGLAVVPAIIAGAWLALDAKTLDFSINGMETGIWVGFLGYAIWAQLGGSKNWIHMGCAWAGLMWTRPDCFIHISLLACGSLLFLGGPEGEGRGAMIGGWLKSAALTTALYLPWFAGAWWYYGTPVPHTVAAKGGLGLDASVGEMLTRIAMLPFGFGDESNSMLGTFLPSYYMLGGWPDGLILAAQVLAALAGLAWLLPKVSRAVRWLSFVYFGIHVYLSVVPYFVFPWYLPAAAPFAMLVLGGLLRDWLGPWSAETVPWRRRGLLASLAAVTILFGVLNWEVAKQMRAQQHWIEDDIRTRIGLHLREQAQAGDTVFTEPLGYVGYFSGLKTYDFPGMSSPEMVAAREAVGESWRDLIDYLQPDWVVLRPHELARIEKDTPWRMTDSYQVAAHFDNKEAVEALDVSGRGYLVHDAVFTLYQKAERHRADHDGWYGKSDSPITFHQRPWGGRIDMHAGVELFFDIPVEATKANLQFGFFGAPEDMAAARADGIHFGAEVRDVVNITPLRTFYVHPQTEDQLIPMSLELPMDRSENAKLRLVVSRWVFRNHDACYMFLPDFASD